MKAKNLVYFFLAINAAAYILGSLAAANAIMSITSETSPYTQAQVQAQFSLTNFSASAVTTAIVGAGIIGVIGWVTKQGVYAIYAVAIWLVGIFFNIFTFCLQGLNSIVNTLLPSDVAFMGGIIYGFVMITFFYALAKTVSSNPSIGE